MSPKLDIPTQMTCMNLASYINHCIDMYRLINYLYILKWFTRKVTWLNAPVQHTRGMHVLIKELLHLSNFGYTVLEHEVCVKQQRGQIFEVSHLTKWRPTQTTPRYMLSSKSLCKDYVHTTAQLRHTAIETRLLVPCFVEACSCGAAVWNGEKASLASQPPHARREGLVKLLYIVELWHCYGLNYVRLTQPPVAN